MKAKTFENLIRKIVREEIDYALRREIKSLKEDLREDIKPIIQEQPLPNNIQSSLKEKIMGTPKKNIPTQQYTSNNALNDLLNETAQGDTNLDGNRSPVSMEGDFSTIGGVPAEAAPKEVVDAVTRDYSSLMEAINKKKNK
tara:strand:+ start:3265 stop:3687 length:423 start_codon:yes stop_codon:yes gene_type:complete